MMQIAGYQTTENAKQWFQYVGIPAATLFATSTLVGSLMRSPTWFATGFAGGAIGGYLVTNWRGAEIQEDMDDLLVAQKNRFGDENGELKVNHELLKTGFVLYTISLTAFTVGYFAIPRIVAFGSGIVSGGVFGLTFTLLPRLVLKEIPQQETEMVEVESGRFERKEVYEECGEY